MFLSKHHYAITLAERGNTVYFINPPLNRFKKLEVNNSFVHENLFIVSYGFFGIQNIRFHSPFIYKILNKFNLLRLKRKLSFQPDIVWNFDFYGYCDNSEFKKSLKISHQVDFIPEEFKKNVTGADVLFSVAKEILEDLAEPNVPSFLVNHGIHEEFFNLDTLPIAENGKVKLGYVGNLLRSSVHYSLLTQLIKQNPEVEFVLIGNYEPSNIGGANNPEGLAFVNQARQYENVVLTGVLNKQELSKKMQEMDLFLIAYVKEGDSCRGTNYHKVMEYLATGKVIVSNFVSAYENQDLLEMIDRDDNEEEIISLFNRVVNNLDKYNASEEMDKRIAFAKDNLYSKQLDRIELILAEL
ncbi:MAG: hypothetical protein JKY48_10425 [Flavobacteriales bacterium]|nr:hypothetical protein [Flavobacteriales bacterium]